jgi:hypothetical protein
MGGFKMRWIAAVLLTLLLAAPSSAQSLYGPGGLFLHPTASVPPRGQFTPSVLVLPQHNPVAGATRVWVSGAVDYGLLDDLEIGVVALKVTNWDRDPSFGGFAKYRFLRETAARPALAAGFTGLTGGDVNTRIGFLAAQKRFNPTGRFPVTGHLGVQYADVVDGVPKRQFQPFAGVELGLTSRLSFIAEGRPRMRGEFGTPLALTLAYQVTPAWRLAVTWANNGLSDRPMFGFGAGFSLGSRK